MNKTCLNCNKDIKKGKFCSLVCYWRYSKNKSKPYRLTGKNIKCEKCGREFYAERYRLIAGIKYCSMNCYNKVPRIFVPWNKGQTAKNNPKIAKPWLGKKMSESTINKLIISHLGKKRSKESCQKQSISVKKNWSKTVYRRKVLTRRPVSTLEKRVLDTINKHNLPYKFVGNGKFFIERKCPDFVNTNGEKIAVEVYARRHKEEFRGGLEKWRQERTDLFKTYGWSIIFIEEWQTNNDESIFQLLKGGN